jgi:hypothetical protein
LGGAAKKRLPLETLADIGWIPMPSIATPYLALFARDAIVHRRDLEDPRVEIAVVPGPRGATWLVPSSEAPLARAFAVADHASREARIAASTTLTSRDLEGTREALRDAMAKPVTLDEIRSRLADGLLRSLGDVGRKAGMPTLASMVLRNMWVTGEVMRVQGEGTLDTAVVRWGIDPRPRTVPTAADAVIVVAARWLAAHGPVSAKAFAAAFQIAAGRANGALKAVKPVEIEIEGLDGTYLAPEGFVPPAAGDAPVRLLPVRDPLTDVHLAALSTGDAARLAMTRAHGVGPTVLLGGEVIGAWNYDPLGRAIAWRPLVAPVDERAQAAIATEAARVSAFIRGELGAVPLHTATPPARARMAAAADLSVEF